MRLRRLEKELGDRVSIAWRAFLLRPHPDARRTLEDFRAYTESWLRPPAEAEGGTFRVWVTAEGPPSHSVPPHLVAKAAATLGCEAFQAMHERLLYAYFAENRDITRPETLVALWHDVGLPAGALARAGDESTLREVVAEHNDAIARGLGGVPAVLMAGNDVPVLGALPYESYRRWVERRLAGEI